MEKQSRLGLILLAVAIFGWFVVLRPQITVFSDRATRAKALSVEVKSYNQRVADVNDIKSKGDAITSTLKAMYLAMPKGSQIPETLVMIESLANSSGVVLSSASIGTPSDSAVPVTLGFSGDLASVTKFLDAVYSNVRTANIKSQSIASDGNGNLSVTMALGLIYQGGTN